MYVEEAFNNERELGLHTHADTYSFVMRHRRVRRIDEHDDQRQQNGQQRRQDRPDHRHDNRHPPSAYITDKRPTRQFIQRGVRWRRKVPPPLSRATRGSFKAVARVTTLSSPSLLMERNFHTLISSWPSMPCLSCRARVWRRKITGPVN